VLNDESPTVLNLLLQRTDNVTRETKVSIARILVKHARMDPATARFLRMSLKYTITQVARSGFCGEYCCKILLAAGMNPNSRWAWDVAINEGNEPVCRLLVEFGSDPFLDYGLEDDDDDDDAASPFLAAARPSDTRIFEFFLTLWNERFSYTHGKNSNGDYPLHVVCCDPLACLQAIKVLVDRQPEVLAVVDGEHGLLPFHFAAIWDASLDVIFYLLQHCPDALHHVGGRSVRVDYPPQPCKFSSLNSSNHQYASNA
jgi:hypothetical protein